MILPRIENPLKEVISFLGNKMTREHARYIYSQMDSFSGIETINLLALCEETKAKVLITGFSIQDLESYNAAVLELRVRKEEETEPDKRQKLKALLDLWPL